MSLPTNVQTVGKKAKHDEGTRLRCVDRDCPLRPQCERELLNAKIEDQQDDAKYSSLEAKFQDKVDNFIPVSYLFRFSKYYSQE